MRRQSRGPVTATAATASEGPHLERKKQKEQVETDILLLTELLLIEHSGTITLFKFAALLWSVSGRSEVTAHLREHTRLNGIFLLKELLATCGHDTCGCGHRS